VDDPAYTSCAWTLVLTPPSMMRECMLINETASDHVILKGHSLNLL
jgi:hypothetical protein